jgi:predicted transcriptional regulator
MSETLSPNELIKCSVKLASAYIGNNPVSLEELPSIIAKVYQILADTNRNPHNLRKTLPLNPAVPIEDSVNDDYIVCLEDGKKLQMLKRHLKTVYNMTLEQYKERWGLGADYPVVSPNYARRRSQIAKNTGLGLNGRKGRKALRAVTGEAAGQTQYGVAVNR